MSPKIDFNAVGKEKSYDYVFTFGKHKGKTVRHIMNTDPRYLLWCCDKIEGFKLERRIKDDLTFDIDEDAFGDLDEFGVFDLY